MCHCLFFCIYLEDCFELVEGALKWHLFSWINCSTALSYVHWMKQFIFSFRKLYTYLHIKVRYYTILTNTVHIIWTFWVQKLQKPWYEYTIHTVYCNNVLYIYLNWSKFEWKLIPCTSCKQITFCCQCHTVSLV